MHFNIFIYFDYLKTGLPRTAVVFFYAFLREESKTYTAAPAEKSYMPSWTHIDRKGML